MSDSAHSLTSDYTNCEVVLARETESGSTTQIYMTDETGLMLNAEESSVNLTKDGEIGLQAAVNKELLLNSDTIKLGDKDADYEEAVLGKQLSQLLRNLVSDLQSIATAANGSPYTIALSGPIQTAASNLSNAINNILAANLKIN